MSKKFRIIRQIGWIAFECRKNSALDKMALKIRNLYDNNPRVMNFFEFLIEFFRHQILLSKFFCRRFYSRKNYVQKCRNNSVVEIWGKKPLSKKFRRNSYVFPKEFPVIPSCSRDCQCLHFSFHNKEGIVQSSCYYLQIIKGVQVLLALLF